MTRALVYNRFWHSRGGGERHSGMIAQVLAQGGVEVDLLSHEAVDLAELGGHLGLDLSRCQVRVELDDGELATAELTEDYDLFVNACYLSRVSGRARRNAYLCYFPTPFDVDMRTSRRVLARHLGPHARRHAGGVLYGLGWHVNEGGRRRRWSWTTDASRLELPAGGPRTLLFDLGRPGLPEGGPVSVVDDAGLEIGRLERVSGWLPAELALRGSTRPFGVTFLSPTDRVPGDNRDLGVAVSRLRVRHGRYGPRELLGYQYPWLLRDAANLGFLRSYQAVMANSAFTKGWVARSWHVDADVLLPPVAVHDLAPQTPRRPVVLTVGRYFSPELGHGKRQLEMVEMFGRGVRSGAVPPDWELVVAGGCEPSQLPYLHRVQQAARGLPVTVLTNVPRDRLRELLQTSSVYWSATGLHEDAERRPWTQEHFGMTTVEAMAGGCVPVVIDRAGHREIVRDGVDGFRWQDEADLLRSTALVATDDALRARLAASATARAQEFGADRFARSWAEIVAARDLLP